MKKSKCLDLALDEAIYVTKPLMPNIDELKDGIESIYSSGILTNAGPVHNELEVELKKILGGKDFLLFSNGTIALMAALAALKLPPGSEVITTPFTFSATVHAIKLLNLTPVFADITTDTMTIDPQSVERCITDKTSCILGVHVYGYPCDVVSLANIAKKNNLNIVYDAAHAFDCEISNKKLGEYGDITMFSFHATKLFNTVEGGGLSINKQDLVQKARDYRNFGITGEVEVTSVGLNGKMSELHSLVGLLNLKTFPREKAKRKAIYDLYINKLSKHPLITIEPFNLENKNSFQYFPIRIKKYRNYIYDLVKECNVYTRKYFYPLCSDYECYKDIKSKESLDNAKLASEEVLCLPFYGDLDIELASYIAENILRGLNDF